MARKRIRKDKLQLAFELNDILKAFEDSFIYKLTDFFNKITNRIIKKTENLSIFKSIINKESVKDIQALKKLLNSYYKEIGKATITHTNKEIKELTGQSSRIRIPSINEGLRLRAEDLAKQKIRDFNATLKKKVLEQEGTLKEKAILIQKIKSANRAFINRNVLIVSRMESVTACNQQRLEAFNKSSIVKGVQFMAIIDDSTTPICRPRNGMVLRLDDPLLLNFTPPLHWGCRSVLSPVTIYEKNVNYTSYDSLKNVPDKDFGTKKPKA